SNDDSNQSVNTGTPGNQVVELKITSGPFSGKSCQAISPNVSNSGAHCVPGLNVITRIVPRPDGQFSATVYNYDRGIFLWILIGLFFFLLCLTGGKKGITSSAALIFTFVCIIFLYIPLM
ncbi:MAG TPA: YibE/F family protein, partial [Clostridia bacterium]|nr:YibE/F family protein [Clostridia bacterium]